MNAAALSGARPKVSSTPVAMAFTGTLDPSLLG